MTFTGDTMPDVKPNLILIMLALIFFLCAAFNLPRRAADDTRAAIITSWRDLAYACITLYVLIELGA